MYSLLYPLPFFTSCHSPLTLFILLGVQSEGHVTYTPVHVINIEIQDNHEEATLGAFLILELCEMVKIIVMFVLCEMLLFFS